MFQAQGRVKDTEEWRTITWGGRPHIVEARNALEFLVFQMRVVFFKNEYRIVNLEEKENECKG